MILFQVMPETEGRTLEEIECFFSDKTRALTDRHIKPIIAADKRTSVAKEPIKADGAVGSLDNPAFVEGV